MFNKKLKNQILSLQARIMELEKRLSLEKSIRAQAEEDLAELCSIADSQATLCFYFSKYIVETEEAKAKKLTIKKGKKNGKKK